MSHVNNGCSTEALRPFGNPPPWFHGLQRLPSCFVPSWLRGRRSHDLADRRNRIELKVREQPLEPRFRSAEISVMPQLGELRQRKPRLVLIDFPWMQIEHDRLAFDAVDPVDPPPGP